MSKRKARSKDPHSWIKDTTKKAASSGEPAAEASEAEASDASGEEEEAEDESAPRRYVIVEYVKSDGLIVAAHEAPPGAHAEGAPPSLSEERATVRLALKGELLDKTPLDLYRNYKVDVSKKRPTLAPKA